VLLSSLFANAKEIAAGELFVLPFVDPRISVAFAILRLEARTLPPIAEALIREVIAADRAALHVERELAARLTDAPLAGSAAARPPKRRLAAAVTAAR
jgi:hypothetical protein